MDITVSLRHGPLNIEIEADTEEDYRQEILDLTEFFQDNKGQFEIFDIHSPDIEAKSDSEGPRPTELSYYSEPDQGEEPTETPSSRPTEILETEGEKFSSISRRTGVDKDVLARMFDVPDDEEELPAIIIEEFEDGVDILGPNRTERQARSSLMLLYL